jgi:hypothetical protein
MKLDDEHEIWMAPINDVIFQIQLFKSAQFDQARGEARGLDQNAKTWNLVQLSSPSWRICNDISYE